MQQSMTMGHNFEMLINIYYMILRTHNSSNLSHIMGQDLYMQVHGGLGVKSIECRQVLLTGQTVNVAPSLKVDLHQH